eukprot:5436820-Pyramimonas_sp.AAC.1
MALCGRAPCKTGTTILPRIGVEKGTDAAAMGSFSHVYASWEALVATAGFATQFWSERTSGEVQGPCKTGTKVVRRI